MARRAFRAYGMSVVSVQREPPAGFFAHAQLGRIYAIHHPLFIDGNNRMIGVRHDILSFCRLSEGLDELLPVNLILIDVLAPVTPAQDVINRAGKFNPQATGHAKRLPKSPLPINR